MPFVDYRKSEPCLSREHQPPMHISLKPGEYMWECPTCGLRQVVRVPGIIYQTEPKDFHSNWCTGCHGCTQCKVL